MEKILLTNARRCAWLLAGLLLLLLCAQPALGSTLTVTSPSSSVWTIGEVREIAWTHTSLAGTDVRLELWRGGLTDRYYARTIAVSVPADAGSFSWTIPDDLQTADDYWVSVRSVSDSAVMDSGHLYLFPPTCTLTIRSPSGHVWTPGETHEIAWTQAGATDDVKIELWRGGLTDLHMVQTIVPSVPGDTGSLSWTIPETLPPADDYWVYVTCLSTPGVTDRGHFFLFPPVNQDPVAELAASPLSGVVPLTVAFSASGSSDSDGTIESYLWDFGDGSSGNGVSASKIYTAPGTYTATLTVTDNEGARAIATATIIARTPAEGIADLIASVERYGIKADVETGLTDKLDIAIAALDAGNERMAINNLNAFIKLAKAQRGKALTPTLADTLIAEAQEIAAGI
ncbi:MAG: PKD domain-containing protein [Methanospirillum sp.]